MRTRELGFTAVVLGALLLPKVANAQEWLKDRRYSEGAGVQAGDFEIHPGIAGEIGYDSNYFLRTSNTGANIINGGPLNPVQGAGELRITPSLSLATTNPQRQEDNGPPPLPPPLIFRGGLAATYQEFLFNSALTNQRNVGGNADARIDIAKGRPIGAIITANYGRTIQPTVLGNPDLSYNRDDVGASAAIVVQPGGGTLDWQFGYGFHGTFFENDGGQSLSNITNEANTRGRWNFRPKTALIYDATLRFNTFTDATNEPGGLQNSTPVRTRIGMNGLITPRLALLVMAGYGASFFDTSASKHIQQYDSVIGQAEAKFYLTPTTAAGQPGAMTLTVSSLAIGYIRDFQNSYLGDFYGTDKGYLNLSYFFGGRALVSLTGSVGAIEYPELFFTDGTQRSTAFTDLRAEATLYGEYRLSSSFALNATFNYSQEFSSKQLAEDPAVAGTNTNLVYDMSWQRITAFAGVRWFL